MTSLEKMLKRMELEHKNAIRQAKGEKIESIPVELMTEEEYKEYSKSKAPKVEVKEIKEVKKEETKTPIVKEEKTVEEVKETKENDKKIDEIKIKINSLVEGVEKNNATKPLILDYRNLSSSKKKEEISLMLKSMLNDIVKDSNNINMVEVIEISSLISSLASQNNKRDYVPMLKSLKENLSKIKNSLISEIIGRIDREIQNFILINKFRFIESIKNKKFNIDITEANIDSILRELDSIKSKLENGEDFFNIEKSLSHFAMAVNEEFENIKEESHNEDKDIEVAKEENNEDDENLQFLSPEEVDELNDLAIEVMSGLNN